MKKYRNETYKPEVEENIELTATEEVNEEAEAEEAVETPVVFGFVSNCSRLNIRKSPDASSEPLCVVEKGSELCIDGDCIEGWYSVTTESGIRGFCMSKFVVLK